MELISTLLLLGLGILLIVKGGDFFVDAAGWMAEVSGIPKFIVGATIVSLATTLPELIVSLLAAAGGKADMAAGNAIGSVTANTGLIMAVSILCLPAVIHRKKLMGKGLLMLASAAALLFSCWTGVLTLGGSVILLLLFVLFLAENLHGARRAALTESEEAKARPEGKIIAANLVKFLLGAAGIVIGADLLVDNGSTLARLCGVSERIIGVTVLAVGTALPELVTTITAVVKKQASLSIGNIIGANIIDLCLILPLCAAVSGGTLPIARQAVSLYLPVCLTVGAAGILPALLFGRFRRWQGVLMLGIYLLFLLQV